MTAGAMALVITDGVVYGLLLFLIGLGMSLCMYAGRVLNLAHGTVVLAGAYLVWWFQASSASAWIAASGMAAAVGAVAGVLVLLLSRLAGEELRTTVATAGLGYVGGWLLPRVAGGEPQSVSPPTFLAGSLEVFGRPYPQFRIGLVCIAAVVGGALLLFWHASRTGLLLRAVAADADLLTLYGFSSSRIRAAVVVGSSALACMAGVWAAPVTGAASGLDHTIVVSALVISLAGGATLWGTLVAALTLGQLQTSVLLAWPAGAPYLPYGTLIVILLLRGGAARYRQRPS